MYNLAILNTEQDIVHKMVVDTDIDVIYCVCMCVCVRVRVLTLIISCFFLRLCVLLPFDGE